MNDWQFPYGDDVLKFITDMDTDLCLFDFETASICESLDKKDELAIKGIIEKIKNKFDVDDETAEEYLYAWGMWAKQIWDLDCPICGCLITVGRFTSGHGCLCGTKFDFPEWGKYTYKAPTEEQRNGTITIELDEFDKVDWVLDGNEYEAMLELADNLGFPKEWLCTTPEFHEYKEGEDE